MTASDERLQDKLLDACDSGDVKEIKRILKGHPSWANLLTLDVPGWASVLHDAAENGNVAVCEVLLSCGADVNKSAAALGYVTPLVQAAEEGHLPVVQLLIGKGAYVDGVDETSASPLICAVDSRHSEVVDYLIAHGADVNRLDHIRRYYAVDFADRNNDKKILTLLRKAGGLGVQSKVKFEARPGYPVISLVSNHVGPVYPVPFSRGSRRDETVFHVASIEETKGKLLMLFTSGVYLHGQPVDMNVVLPADWPILQNYLVQPSALSFPFDFMSRMVGIARSSTDQVSHGMFVKPSDPTMQGLIWPRDIAGMVAVDYAWPKRRNVSASGNAANGDVTLLTFVPTKDEFKSEKARMTWSDKKRKAAWKALSFPGWEEKEDGVGS